jgi:hypothetical protein
MRDEFSTPVKDTLAKRVAFRCSNPGCRQATSGPQQGTPGTVNIGVAAHMTAASPGGPRFNPALTPEDRASAANGLWLCQTCAKLIDSDETGYSVDRLLDWKCSAETAAAEALKRRRSPESDPDAAFIEAQRIMPELLAEMGNDLRNDSTELIREFVISHNRNCIFNHTKPRFEYYESDHSDLQLKVDWLVQMGFVAMVRVIPSPIYRMTPEFVMTLRGTP